jgi:NAD-dependent deacetylase
MAVPAGLAAPLVAALRETDGLTLVVTGAGVSAASGIPTFRGPEPGAVWRRHDVEIATRACLERDPVAQWSWYLDRFAAIDGARPNPAHHALVDLGRRQERAGGELVLVTQNIDCLHEAAGSVPIKVHGSSDRVRCSAAGRCGRAAPHGSLPRSAVDLAPFRECRDEASLPRCSGCGSILRAHVLFFDEYYTEHADYRVPEVEAAAASCDLVLFVGTSFSVGITDLVLREAVRRGRPLISVDPAGFPAAVDGVLAVLVPAVVILPWLCEALGDDEPLRRP